MAEPLVPVVPSPGRSSVPHVIGCGRCPSPHGQAGAEVMDREPDIAGPYEEQVHAAAEAVLIMLKLADSTEELRNELLFDMHSLPTDTGMYRVTSNGRKVWEGKTLMGAVTAQVTGNYQRPVRIWHTGDGGRRRLVLVDNHHRTY